jgi:hypothetical protein
VYDGRNKERQMERNWWISLVALIGVALSGCGDGSGDLSKEAVTSIPPGSAKGTAFGGSYTITLVTTTCSGTCPALGIFSICSEGAKDTEMATVTQKDGKLEMVSSGLIVNSVAGGINSDGNFDLGGYGTQGSGAVAITARVTGTIANNGKVTGTARALGVGSVKVGTDTININCSGSYALTGARK